MIPLSKHTWYVSFRPKKPHRGTRVHSRATETFPDEADAKKFAKEKAVDTPNVTAGTLNPHRPKRTISTAQLPEWLEQAEVIFQLKRPRNPRAIGEARDSADMPTKKANAADEDWEAAQANLEAARQLPAGVERIEALKKAGQLRYDADKKRTRESEQSRS
jgi:hypothetical protein